MTDAQRADYFESLCGELVARIAVLEAELTRLRSDSSNSSKPPSRDGNDTRESAKQTRQQRRVMQRQDTRKPGKQPGSEGRYLARVVNPDVTIVHTPASCSGCGKSLQDGVVVDVTNRQVFDLPPIGVHVTDHRVEHRLCGCGSTTTAAFPAVASAAACWGPGVKALAVYLSVRQHLPVARTAEIVSDVLNTPVSTGFIVNAQTAAANRLDGFMEHIKKMLGRSTVMHADETSTRVSAATYWVHVASTPTLTWLGVHRNRGRVAITDHAILPGFKGVLVRDGLATYDDLEAIVAQCGAHLLRHLENVGRASQHQPWTTEMSRILLDAKTMSETGTITSDQIRWFHAQYRSVMLEAFAACPPGPRPRGKQRHSNGWTEPDHLAHNLACRFRDQEPDVLRYLTTPNVPFTNNQAERDLRMTKLHDKISGTFRNDQAARNWATTRSYIQTATKNRITPLQALNQLFTTTAWLPT